MKRILILYAGILLLLGCQQKAGRLSEKDIEAIKELHAKTEAAVFSNDWDEILKLYTDDAIQIAPKEEPLIGKSDIAGRMYPLNFNFIERENIIQEIDGNGDIAFYWSRLTQKIQVENGDSISVSGARMIRILKKQKEGSWLVSHDIWNYDNK